MVQVNLAKAKSSFSEYANRAAYTNEHIVITKRGKPFVALISVNDLEILEGSRQGLLKMVYWEPLAWHPSLKKWLRKPWRYMRKGATTLAER